MGGRGISYKSSNHAMHLTDEYLYINPKSSRQHTSIQLASRICGRYKEESPPLQLRLWCAEKTWRLISGMIKLEDEIVKVAREAYLSGVPVFQALKLARFPKFEHIEHLKQLRIASPKVMRHWMAKDSLRLPDGTALGRSTGHYWDLRLNRFLKTGDAAAASEGRPRPKLAAGTDERAPKCVLRWTPDELTRCVPRSLMISGIAAVRRRMQLRCATARCGGQRHVFVIGCILLVVSHRQRPGGGGGVGRARQ